MIGSGTKIADDHFPVKINGDAALLKGLVKVILEEGQLDWDFIDTHTEGFEAFKQSAEEADWDDIVEGSGISRERITKLGLAVANSKRLIICWALARSFQKSGCVAAFSRRPASTSFPAMSKTVQDIGCPGPELR